MDGSDLTGNWASESEGDGRQLRAAVEKPLRRVIAEAERSDPGKRGKRRGPKR